MQLTRDVVGSYIPCTVAGGELDLFHARLTHGVKLKS